MNRIQKIIPILMAGLLHVGYSADVVIDGGITLTNSGGSSNCDFLVVGSNTANNGYVLDNGGTLCNASTGYIGYAGSSTNNQVLVNGGTWSNATDVYLGFSGNAGFNRIIVTNGGVWKGNGIIRVGMVSCASNYILITGSNSVWTNNGSFRQGYSGNHNILELNDGAKAYFNSASFNFAVGYGSYDNEVVVNGTNTILDCSSGTAPACLVGTYGIGNNKLIVENGGYIHARYIQVAPLENNTNNQLIITGNGSRLTCDSYIELSFGGRSSSIIVSNGGTLAVNDTLGMRVFHTNNVITIDGTGSVFSNRYTLNLGLLGGKTNELRICNGGYVYALSNAIGQGASAEANVERIYGNGSVLETKGVYIGENGGGVNGMVISNGGRVTGITNLVVADTSYVTNYVSGYSGGLDLRSNCALSVNGQISIVYCGRIYEPGIYWGLRWAGNHTTELENARTAGNLSWNDGSLGPFDRGRVGIYYDPVTTNTYVGYVAGAGGTMVTVH